MSRAKLKYLVTGAYSLEGWEENDGNPSQISHHPVTLSTESYSRSNGILSYPVSVTSYEVNLQNKFDTLAPTKNGFINLMKISDDISKIVPDLNIIILAQAHLWWKPEHKLKEPSNEELSLMSNLSVSYGAKGIMWFNYESNGNFSIPDTPSYRGMTNTDLTPRHLSVYGQDKWEGVKKINTTLKTWEPYIMSFDNANRKSYILRSEYNDLYSQTYFYSLAVDGITIDIKMMALIK